jgi:PAB-dependent poly(A)-specific ribonuclease subunit 2
MAMDSDKFKSMFDSILKPKDLRGKPPNLSKVMMLELDELSSALKDNGRFIAAIDAEFVALTREEVEIKPDGSKSVIKPSQMHLARVSVVRGQGLHQGCPFIDDYINTTEEVADYLTEFSGIVPADLNFSQSKQTLVSLKNAYRKLSYLIDLGCIFIGHGLKKDFRTINIFVQSSQVIDTVDIYRIRGQRKISLRYLSWYVLGKDIQSQSHDSVVDAQIVSDSYDIY